MRTRNPITARAATALCCFVSLAGQEKARLGGVKRIYVDSFTVEKNSARLRGDVLAQLKKLGFVTIVSEQSRADAVLSGDGEIWVKGYQSLNPRSGRLPSAGRPLYSGFLSVELKDTKGETIWSYLVAPISATEDISKELSKRVGKHLADALDQSIPTSHP